MTPQPLLPDYEGRCVTRLVDDLLGHDTAVVPADVHRARAVVLLVLDGLGWEQLRAEPELAPTLHAMDGGAATTICPTTTATALTSITGGLTPGEHGIVGYRMVVDGQVLNVLRWNTADGDARLRIPPKVVQPIPPFQGSAPPVVTKADFARSGFTLAHLAGARFAGWRVPSTMVTEVARLTRAGERFVYAYYDGVDKVAHEYGLGEHYRAELAAADRLVGDVLAALPSGVALVVTSDHGQVDVGDRLQPLDDDVLELTTGLSGEGRFRWLHCPAGRVDELLAAAEERYGHQAWVRSRAQVIDEGWFGPKVSEAAAARLGDVCLVPFEPLAFDDPDDTGPYPLEARHGSLTSAEVLVPVLAATS